MTDLDKLARDDTYIKRELTVAHDMMGKQNCDYPTLIHGLGLLLFRCNEGMVSNIQATIMEATRRQAYEAMRPKKP